MYSAPILIAALATALAGAQAAVPDHRADIKHAVFDLCPKVFTGEISLTDPTQVAAIGYKATPPRETPGGKIPRAETGEGATKIVIAGQAGADPSCSIWFGGPDNKAQLGYVLTEASATGYQVGSPASLGDGTMLLQITRRKAVPAPAHKTMVVIGADAGGEFGADPATTIILMK
ncbi:hypothetical protein P1X14_20045 [Sphingomonas sp. AOB5]|uniref:hypothetical protein n=1 Tax=Sphingomonas sp. AOB5 TaxID=3034017 RepID=UPI0023F78B1E|nr:hypothetical protein [Sphingomonas sp. AOB5]MDF7777558.1 hypothetical protein [Sphingomonas sp. AOB5]